MRITLDNEQAASLQKLVQAEAKRRSDVVASIDTLLADNPAEEVGTMLLTVRCDASLKADTFLAIEGKLEKAMHPVFTDRHAKETRPEVDFDDA